MGPRRVVASVVFLSVVVAATGAALLTAGGALAAIPGDVLWSKRVSTPFARDDSPVDLAVGPDGSAYVLSLIGTGHDPLLDTMICLTRFAPRGDARWQRTFSSRGALTDYPVALALDDGGNAFIAGATLTAGSVYEGLLIKYTAAGRRSWVRRWAGATTGSDRFTDIACDAAGDVVVCGHENLAEHSSGFFVRKYRSNGSTRWSRHFGASLGSNEGAEALAVDPRTGAVYVGGSLAFLRPWAEADEDAIVVKYGAGGRRIWVTQWESAGDWGETVQHLVVGTTGEIYMGVRVDDVVWGHLAVVNLGPGGRLHWSDSDADKTPAPAPLQIQAMTVDGRDRVRVLLLLPHMASPPEVRLYGADGSARWQRALPLVVSDAYTAHDMAVTGSGRAYVTGDVDWADERNAELFVTALKADGRSALWTTYRRGPGGRDATGSHVALSDGRLFVAGWCDGGTTGDDVRTMRLVP